jgi:pimeloyl-ACP methyl ester carboxylesterase
MIVDTVRLKTHLLSSGPETGIPVIFIHGNLVSAIFWEETMLALPADYRAFAPDLRGFGKSETKPVDATRGIRDFSDDLHDLVEKLGLISEGRKVHLVGWSMGGGIIMQYALDHPHYIASLTLVCPMSPYGFGGTKDAAGTPCWPDMAGSGGGAASPEFAKRLAAGDRSGESDLSPRRILNKRIFSPPFRATTAREEQFVSALLQTAIGEANYPGALIPSKNWPGFSPGTTGVLNAMSPKYLNLSSFARITPQPPVLWVRGGSDRIISDTSLFDFGYLGQVGGLPNWPGQAIYPPQPMITQTRAVLDNYRARGGQYREEVIPVAGHAPHVEQPEAFQKLLFEFVQNH